MPKTVDVFTGFVPHEAQQELWDDFLNPDYRFLIAACGRRWGKTEIVKTMLAYTGLQGKRAAYMAPTVKMMIQVWEELKQMLAPAIAKSSEAQHRLDLLGGGVIEFWSLDNPEGPRGREYDFVALDECALLPSSKIFEAVVSPTISTRQGKAVFTSTPRGLNWFYHYWVRGADPLFPQWRSYKFPTISNPYFPPDELVFQRQNNPKKIFRQEFEADFLGDSDGVFRVDEKKLDAVWQDAGLMGRVYVAGVDLARSEDFSVIHVLDITEGEVVEQVHIDATQDIEFELQIGRIGVLHEKFGFLSILIEDNAAGRPVFERMENLGLPVVPFHTTNISKTMLVNALSLRFERGWLRLLNHEMQLAQLRAYEASRLPSGLIRYAAPRDGHDDHVQALMLANWAAEGWTVGQAGFVRFG